MFQVLSDWCFPSGPSPVLPIILGDISQGLGVESSLGVLTSLPLLMFTSSASFYPWLAQKIGLEHLFTYSLFFLTIGSLIRLINLPLYLGTLMVGKYHIINVLLPSLISQSTKEDWFLTTLYVASMGIATALASIWLCLLHKPVLGGTYHPPHPALPSNFFWSGCLITAIITDWLHKQKNKAKVMQ